MMLKCKDVLLLKLDKKTYYIKIFKSAHDTDTLRLYSGVNPQLTKKSTEADNGEVSEIVASKVGIGSKDTYRKEKYIVDNADTLTPKEELTRYPRTGGIDFRLLSTTLTLG